MAIATAFAGDSLGKDYSGGVPWQPNAWLPPDRFDPSDRFFTAAERRFMTAAVDRLIPPDEFPGASDLGVVDFIDSQLAGSFGRGDIFYMQPPFREGTDSQGYQAREPAWLYRTAIADTEKVVAQRNEGRSFSELSNDEQDQILSGLEDGSLELSTVYGDTFFDMLLQNTIEGYFGDPVHGGNRDMAAWRMIGFPGARYDYRPYVSRHNERLDLEPVSVGGYWLNTATNAPKGD